MLRALVGGTLVFVAFASMDNVALVFLIKQGLHGSAVDYGGATAAYGAGMVAASLALAAWASRRPAAHWLIGGFSLGAAGTAATALAPSVVLGCAAQAAAGAGNTADLIGTDTLIQQAVPAGLLSRAFGVVYAAAQLASSRAYAAAGPLVALTSPRTVFLIAAAGMLIGLACTAPAVISATVSVGQRWT